MRKTTRLLVTCGIASLTASALAQDFRIGSTVEASPQSRASDWRRCIVVERDASGAYQVSCPFEPQSDRMVEGWVAADWIRTPRAAEAGPARTASAPSPSRATASPRGAFTVGAKVMASPTQIPSGWTRCEVIQHVQASDVYQLDCVNEIGDAVGNPMLTVARAWVPAQWVKADDPAFRPGLQVQAGHRAEADRARPRPTGQAPVAADARATGLPPGEYACYGSGQRILAGFGFRLMGGGRYTDLDGRSAGRYAVSGTRVSFTGGHLNGQTGRDFANNGFTNGAMATCQRRGG